jgi:hypothetical protein
LIEYFYLRLSILQKEAFEHPIELLNEKIVSPIEYFIVHGIEEIIIFIVNHINAHSEELRPLLPYLAFLGI